MNLYRDSLMSFGSESKEEHDRIHLTDSIRMDTF